MEKVYRSYYTESDSLVRYMIDLLSVAPGMSVLEPCAGGGVFVDALLRQALNLNFDLFELNPEAYSSLKEKYRNIPNVRVTLNDALVCEQLRPNPLFGGYYDRIIANPPYGGWQEYHKRKSLKHVFPGFYVKETYSLFLLKCIELLKEQGRLVFIIPDTWLNLHRHTKLRNLMLLKTKIKEISLFPSHFFPGVSFGYAGLSIVALERCSNEEECLNNIFRIRNNLESADEFLSPIHTEGNEFSQREIYHNIDHSFFVAENSNFNELINSSKLKISDIADCVTGFYSGNDKKYLRPLSPDLKNAKKYHLLDSALICRDFANQENILEGIEGNACFIPIVKGGSTQYFKPDLWYMNWSRAAVRHYKEDSKARFQNPSYYFRYGVGVPMVSSTRISAALIENRLFDQSIVGVFPHNPKWTYYLLAFFNSTTCNVLIRTINSSANNPANYIKKIPFVEPGASLFKEISRFTQLIVAEIKAGGSYDLKYEKLINKHLEELYGNNLKYKSSNPSCPNLLEVQ